MKHLFAPIVAVLTIFVGQIEGEERRVNVTVYYEALCPYARRLIVNELYPTLEGNLAKYVELTLIPYGKAKIVSPNNNPIFLCQHGPRECYGNLILTCAQELIDSGADSSNLGFNVNNVKFVRCFVGGLTGNSTQTDIEHAVDNCSAAISVSSAQLKQCTNSTLGLTHLVQYGKITDQYQNPLKHMPTIIFQNEFDEEDNASAQVDFEKVLCSKITWAQPEEC